VPHPRGSAGEGEGLAPRADTICEKKIDKGEMIFLMEDYNKISKPYEAASGRDLRKFACEAMFIQNLGSLEGKMALDLACGEGCSSRVLKKLGAKKVIGIDVSEEMLKLAEEKDKGGITYFRENIFECKFSKYGKFDVITSVLFFDYIPKKELYLAVLKEINLSLKEKGVFYMITPNPEAQINYSAYGINNTADSNKDGAKVIAEITDFSGKKLCSLNNFYWKKETIEEFLKNAGFRVEWLPAFISKEGLKKYGKAFWAKYEEKPMYVMLKAAKTD